MCSCIVVTCRVYKSLLNFTHTGQPYRHTTETHLTPRQNDDKRLICEKSFTQAEKLTHHELQFDGIANPPPQYSQIQE